LQVHVREQLNSLHRKWRNHKSNNKTLKTSLGKLFSWMLLKQTSVNVKQVSKIQLTWNHYLHIFKSDLP